MTGHPDYNSSDTGKVTKVQHSYMPGLVASCYKLPLSLCIKVCYYLTIYLHSDGSILEYDSILSLPHSSWWWICLDLGLLHCEWMTDVSAGCYTDRAKKWQRKFVTDENSPCWLDCGGAFVYLQSGINCSPSSWGYIGYNYRLQLGSLQGNSWKQNVLHS